MLPTVYLLDGHAIAYRAYFALTGGVEDVARRWVTSQGEPTAATYGFASILLRMLQEKPDYLAVAFDTGRSFRDDLYPEYKATRAKMPDEMQVQMDRIYQLVEAFGFPILEYEGYEADDVLGSVAHRLVREHEDLGVRIITGDRDLLQLVTERIIVTLPGRKLADAENYTPQRVKEELGILPRQLVDYKALVGDKSDNIPGVPGIGHKTAVRLLQQYGDLDGIYAHLAELSPGVRKKLEAHRELAYLSRQLAQIRTDLDLSLPLEEARTWARFDLEKVDRLFRELEFRSLAKRLRQILAAREAVPDASQRAAYQPPLFTVTSEGQTTYTTHLVDTPEALADLRARLEKAREIALDTETDSLNKMRAHLVGLSLALSPNEGYYIPVGHRGGPNLPWEMVKEALAPVLTDPRVGKVGHNIKFDVIVLAQHGLFPQPLTFDTMIAEWLIDPDGRNRSLKDLSWKRLGVTITEIESLIGRGKRQKSMADIPVQEVAPYAVGDVVTVLRLKPLQEKELEARQVARLMRDVEMPLVPVLARMEMAGVAVDADYLRALGEELARRLQEIEERMYEEVGERFNLNSPQQLARILYDRLGLKPPEGARKTSTGRYSTAADILEAMRHQHKVVEWILEHRELAKLKSTYVDALLEQIHPETGRIHTTYNQVGAVTGRVVSQNPNLQNIPIRTELGRKVRRAFIAPPGRVLLAADYSQIELRILAHLSQDPGLIEAFQRGEDIHRTTASVIFEVKPEEVTPNMRRLAKAVNFGLIYGMSAYGLSQTVGISVSEARNFMDRYFGRFPKVKEYLDETLRQAYEYGYVTTVLGRRRYFPELLNPAVNVHVRNRAEREAVNAPIQGSAADILKLAMLRVDAFLREHAPDTLMILQVHDELVFEMPQSRVSELAPRIKAMMENVYSLIVPLVVDVQIGPNWADLTPWEPEEGEARA